MNEKEIKRISKFLSLILRHSPEIIDIKLDPQGWANVDELIKKAGKKEKSFTKAELEEVVETNDKQRFIFDEEQTKIRANQGHSVKNVDLQLESIQPPSFLYHGTVAKFMLDIRKQGLKKMSRQHVHLSKDKDTAFKVGTRRGVPTILSVNTGKMFEDGFEFYCSANGVWLTEQVPTKYIEFK